MGDGAIAELPGVSGDAVKRRLKNLFRKLGASNRTAAVLRFPRGLELFPAERGRPDFIRQSIV